MQCSVQDATTVWTEAGLMQSPPTVRTQIQTHTHMHKGGMLTISLLVRAAFQFVAAPSPQHTHKHCSHTQNTHMDRATLTQFNTMHQVNAPYTQLQPGKAHRCGAWPCRWQKHLKRLRCFWPTCAGAIESKFNNTYCHTRGSSHCCICQPVFSCLALFVWSGVGLELCG